MRFSLFREDGMVGDSGPMCQILDPNNRYDVVPNEYRPKVGYGVRVGSYTGRTFAAQDWWQTSPIVEILEESDTYVKFKTRNSIYNWNIIE